MKYGTKNTKESNKDCKSYGTIDLSFNMEVEVNCTFHFTILCIKLFRHNKFLLQYRYVDKLKITVTICFAKLYLTIFSRHT